MDQTAIQASLSASSSAMQTTPDELVKVHDLTEKAEPQLKKADSPAWQVLQVLGSLRLTVVLLALGILLVFFGTLAQIDAGIYIILKDYFRCWGAWIPLQLFVRFGQIFLGLPHTWEIPAAWGIPFPGGWTIGWAMFVNLTVAHVLLLHRQLRTSQTAGELGRSLLKRSGIYILHAGVVVLMLGEFITGIFQVEGRMTIVEQGSSNYTEDYHKTELAIVHPADPKTDDVTVVPERFLRQGGLIQHDALPFDIEVQEFMVNSELKQLQPGEANQATAGLGTKMRVEPRKPVSGTDGDKTDLASAYVTFKEKGTGKTLGTYLVSLWLTLLEETPQRVTVQGKDYEVALRHRREYKPYTIHLLKFTHEVYPGTTIPKNYSSKVRLVDPTRGEDREVDIFMNNPLRYEGETFFQSGFLPGDKGTILQVVRNPAWTMPYISCGLVALGMLIHFGISLVNFLSGKLQTPPLLVREGPLFGRLFPWLVLGFCGLYVLLAMTRSGGGDRGEFNLADFGRLPVLQGGRPKPLDTLARDSLIVISNRQSFAVDGKDTPAAQWLLDVLVSRFQDPRQGPVPALEHKVFRIDNEEVLSLLGLERRSGYRYALAEFVNKMPQLERAANTARQVDAKQRKPFEQKVVELAEHLQVYKELASLEDLLLVPPASADGSWQTLPAALRQAKETGEKNPATMHLINLLGAYVEKRPDDFNREVVAYQQYLDGHPSAQIRKTNFEYFYNAFRPFMVCTVFYLVVFLLSVFSWLGWSAPLRSAAFWLAILTLLVHTWALLARMYLMNRWGVFITNLYGTAVFIGWFSLILSLVLEVIFPLGLATAVGGLIGFLTTLLAHYLARTGGDTLGMLQAVLDTDFWLMTHVTIINIGYAATFVAGFLGFVYLLVSLVSGPDDNKFGKNFLARGLLYLFHRGPFVRALEMITGERNPGRIINWMIYGIVCFALLFSFVGTVLGGLWADQSWGRFWGWDPKENGALIIVLWNALILHARWCGLVKQTGTAVLAVAGNMVTLWSWFGTNQLGVGLHAYGFSNTLAMMLTVIWGIHIAFIGLVLGFRKYGASGLA